MGPVFVAADSAEIADAVRECGGDAVTTKPEHASGSDRIYEALCRIDPDGTFDSIINLQGDLPTLEPRLLRSCGAALNKGADIGTLAAVITDPAEIDDPNVVKAIASPLVGGLMSRRSKSASVWSSFARLKRACAFIFQWLTPCLWV